MNRGLMREVDRLMRLREVVNVTGLSASTIRRREQAGKFPRRLQLSVQAIGWKESEVMRWVEELETTATEEGLDV